MSTQRVARHYIDVFLRGPSDLAKQSYIVAVNPRAPTSVHVAVRRFSHPPQTDAMSGVWSRYTITGLSLWSFAARGGNPESVIATLKRLNDRPLPSGCAQWVKTIMGRYGSIKFRSSRRTTSQGHTLFQMKANPVLLKRALAEDKRLEAFCYERGAQEGEWFVPRFLAGRLKYVLGWLGYPVVDHIARRHGTPLAFALRNVTRSEKRLKPRLFQREGRQAFKDVVVDPELSGGVFVGPPGIGKTLEAIMAAVVLQGQFLIITTSDEAVRQWREELLDKTTLHSDDIGEYTSREKRIRPVTITTYAMLAWGMNIDPMDMERFEKALAKGARGRSEVFRLGALINEKLSHFDLFQTDDKGHSRWELVIADEADRLPADKWRVAAQIESRFKVGVTSSPIREDGRIIDEPGAPLRGDLFNLLGPVLHEVSVPEARKNGWIPPVECYRVEVPLRGVERRHYAVTTNRSDQRDIARNNSAKLAVVKKLLRRHSDKPVLIMGQYLGLLQKLAGQLKNVPFIHGMTSESERARVYDAFRSGEERVIIVSSIGDRAINLPDATVLIDVSSNSGSRSQMMQRLGRVLRPKDIAFAYILVTPNTPEEGDANKRIGYIVAKGFRVVTMSAQAA